MCVDIVLSAGKFWLLETPTKALQLMTVAWPHVFRQHGVDVSVEEAAQAMVVNDAMLLSVVVDEVTFP